jgi:hypothetical protein
MAYYLRKKGTNLIFIRTKALAERDDMQPVTEEVAKKCLASQPDDAFKRIEANANHKSAAESKEAEAELKKAVSAESDEEVAGTADWLATLSIEALREKADLLKVPYEPGTKEATLRKRIKEAIEADAEEDRKLAQKQED